MIVVDVESTGVDPKLCSLLSVGAVDFDNPKNQFYMECYAFSGAHIEKEALVVAGFTMEEIVPNNQSPISNNQDTPSQSLPTEAVHLSHPKTNAQGLAKLHVFASHPLKRGRGKSTDKEVVEAFLDWMKTCKEWTLVGQNPSFDRDFLQETAHRYHIAWPLAHRTIDLHSVAYFQMLKAVEEIPRKNNHSALNLDGILTRVGLPTRAESHNALEDAKLEAEAFSRLLSGKSLLDEYKRFSVPAGL